MLLDYDHGSGLRNMLDRFLAGESLASLPEPIQSLAGGLAAIRTTERSIEGRMSNIRQTFQHGKNSGPQQVSHNLRFPELAAQLTRHPEVAP